MKACIVAVLPPSESGVALYTLGLISGIDVNKPPFPVVVIANKTANRKLYFKNVAIRRSWNRGTKYFFQTIAAIIKEKPSVVHFQHEFFLYGGLLSALLFPVLLSVTRILNIKVIVTIHGVVPRNQMTTKFANAFFVTPNFFILNGIAILTLIICKLTNAIIVHNSLAKSILTAHYGINREKVRVIHHGIGINKGPEKESVNNSIILFFGNVTPSKGIETLISAFEEIQVPDAKLLIAGSIHSRGKEYFLEIKRLVAKSPASERITLAGYIPDDKIHELFEKSTVAVFPYTIAVSSSGSLSFALQHHKPVIVTSLPTFTETIKNNWNGIVVPPHDPKALAQAIKQILSNEKIRKLMIKRNTELSKELTWTTISEKTLELYRECTAQPTKK
jgi:glycosyltransferase involved in cell wall biosynthesis